MMATDMFGRRFVEVPSVQFALFCREDYARHYGRVRAVACRENGERAAGAVSTMPRKTAVEKRTIAFTAENGKTFLLPLKHLTIERATDVVVIAIAESAMTEHCELYGLWQTSYFPAIR